MILPLWVCLARYPLSTQKNKYTISLHYHQVNVKDEVDFIPADKSWSFLQIDTIIVDVCGQASENEPSLVFPHNTLKKKWVIELTFLIQVNIQTCNKLILWWSSISKFPKIASLPCFYNISKKKLAMKLIFLHADTHQSFLRADFNIVTRWSNHYWWEWSSILKVLNATFSQYLFSNIKKKLWMEFIFFMQININASTSWHYHSWWKRPYISKVAKIGI